MQIVGISSEEVRQDAADLSATDFDGTGSRYNTHYAGPYLFVNSSETLHILNQEIRDHLCNPMEIHSLRLLYWEH